MANMEILKKASVKTVCGKLDKEAIKASGKILLMTVIGIATGIKQGESTYGPWTALMGNFKVKNAKNDKEYRSGQLFLPDVALNLVEPALIENDSVSFAFEILAVYDESSATGYIYSCIPLIEPAENDPLVMLESTIQKALPAPANDEKKTKK